MISYSIIISKEARKINRNVEFSGFLQKSECDFQLSMIFTGSSDLYLYFIVYPLLNGLYYSLTDWNGVGRSYQFVGLANYYKIFHDKTSLSVVGRTFLYTLLLTVICTVLSVFLAILLNCEMKGKSVFRSIYFFPAVLSSITIGLIFNQIYNSLLPQVGSALGIGALSHSLLSSGKTAMWAILVINVWQGTALPTVIAIAGLQAIPVEIRESAKMDGASAWQEFCHVTLPLLMPTVSVIIILNVRSDSWSSIISRRQRMVVPASPPCRLQWRFISMRLRT